MTLADQFVEFGSPQACCLAGLSDSAGETLSEGNRSHVCQIPIRSYVFLRH